MSTQTDLATPTPISITIPPALQSLAIPLRSFLTKNEKYDRLVCSAFIFAPPAAHHHHHHHLGESHSATPSRLLLLRRSATDTAFPNLWEVPGGSIDENDPTILHGLAREVFEETGLRLTRFVRLIGDGIKWTTYPQDVKSTVTCQWFKLSFEIEVAEIGAFTHEQQQQEDVEGYLNSLPVDLDPEEHQEYAWVTEEEIRTFYNEGVGREIISKEQAGKMLEAFVLRREGLE
ncbi:MAG: hypothetical protein Q9186_003656 [Xanthomendoza sp. 1 TL-2023]